jgi:hypothetical protein
MMNITNTLTWVWNPLLHPLACSWVVLFTSVDKLYFCTFTCIFLLLVWINYQFKNATYILYNQDEYVKHGVLYFNLEEKKLNSDGQ